MIYHKIKEERMSYLGNNSTAFSILGLVISELQRTNLGTDIPDEQVVSCIRKLLQGVNESIEKAQEYKIDESKVQQLKEEKEILERYVPTQLSESQLRDIMVAAIVEDPSRKTNKGAMFGYLKSNYNSLYDGKMANILFGTL